MFVSLSVQECVAQVHHELTYGGKLLDQYEITNDGAKRAIVCVYRHYFIRAGNDLTATVTIDDFTGRTRVHWISGGGSDSAWIDFDWGAADQLSKLIKERLQPYRLQENEEGCN